MKVFISSYIPGIDLGECKCKQTMAKRELGGISWGVILSQMVQNSVGMSKMASKYRGCIQNYVELVSGFPK